MARSLLLLAVLGCAGREAPPGVVDAVEIASAHTGETYNVQVFTPDALPGSEGATVAYVFDGPENQIRILDAYRRALDAGAEPAILVLVPGSNRLTDFTPTPNEPGTRGGGQEAFIRFLAEELAPTVERDGAGGTPEQRMVFGHSLGGLLSASLWYDHPFATRAGIASPSLWWDGGLFFAQLDEAPIHVGPIVVTCGEEEPMGMVPYTEDFADTLEERWGVEVTYTCFADATHQGALEPAAYLSFERLLR